MGPKGMVELNKSILQKSQYAIKKLSKIKGVKVPVFESSHFKEFVVDFSQTGKSVQEINKYLLDQNIFGGKDLSLEFTELKNCALYCVTEIHTKEDIDALAESLSEFLK